jgi:hypothetical protein
MSLLDMVIVSSRSPSPWKALESGAHPRVWGQMTNTLIGCSMSRDAERSHDLKNGGCKEVFHAVET